MLRTPSPRECAQPRGAKSELRGPEPLGSGHPAHTALMPDADLTVRLQPRAKRNALVAERDGVLYVSVAAAPVEGQANAALCKLIAKRAGIARGRVSVIRGERSREKVVRVEGLAPVELRRALGLTPS
jgi:hypothetical protein